MASQSRQPRSSLLGGIRTILAEANLRSSAVSELRRRHAHGLPLDAEKLLTEYPELATRKSIVLDLVYEEFCQRDEMGEPIDRDAFCRRFPWYEGSVRRLIEVHDFLDENPHLVPDTTVDWPEPGQRLLGFSILDELGRGGFARVFLAEEIALGRRLVAIKVSLEGTTEAEMLGRLQHPGIVPVYSVQQDDASGFSVVCMPFLGHLTLQDLLEGLFRNQATPTRSRAIVEAIEAAGSGPLPACDATGSIDGELSHGSYIDGALHLGAQLAEAVAYSHGRGVCHSDLKPTNVLITPGGRPMLLDFNLAYDPQAVERRLGGTVLYMAPEQLQALDGASLEVRARIGEKSDVFSLGVILFELLAGEPPFGPAPAHRPARQLRRSVLQRQRAGPRRLRDANRHVDPALAGLIERCLAFAPDQRPASAAELARALRASRATAHRVRRWTRRHYLLSAGTVASLVLAGMAAGYSLATRPPYELREFNKAGEAWRQGDYAAVVAHLDRVLRTAEPGALMADARLWRARAHLELGQASDARRDLRELPQSERSGRVYALFAYADRLDGNPATSAACSRLAIQAGFDTAAVYNNLGYANFCLEKRKLDQAAEALTEAIARKPDSVTSRYNRAIVEFHASFESKRPIADFAVSDIDRVIAARPSIAYVYYDAALVYDRYAQDREPDPAMHRKIVDYLMRALELGVDPETVRSSFPSLRNESALQEALAADVPRAPRRLEDHLVDPLADEPFPFR